MVVHTALSVTALDRLPHFKVALLIAQEEYDSGSFHTLKVRESHS